MPGIQQFDTTMHLLAKVLDLRARNQEVIAANIARFRAGQQIEGLVNRKAGY